MKKIVRSLAAGVVALAVSVALPALLSSATVWDIGDVFAGVGLMDVRSGAYLVRSPTGAVKETLIDPFAGRGGVTTGCAINPDGALYATTFFNRDLTRFDGTGTHTATRLSVPASVTVNGTTWPVEATESIAFHPDGTYYVGALPPARNRDTDPVPPYGFIFKFSKEHALLATYAVPNEQRGADWIDLTVGPGGEPGLYYTSEGEFIHHVKPDPAATGVHVLPEAPGWPKKFTGVGGRLYSIRALPLVAGKPSAFLVAHTSGAFRAIENGDQIQIIQSYPVPPDLPSAHFFALNITPDGQSFWTATFQADVDPKLPRAGRLFRYHIASGDLLTLLDTGADNVWGLCVKREYTAAGNTCHVANADGTYSHDTFECRPIEICNNGADEDGDGVADAADPDCASRTRPTFAPGNQTSVEGETISVQLEATDPNGDVLTYRLADGTSLPAGLSMTADGRITGTLTGTSARPDPYWVVVIVSDGVYEVRAGFSWTVVIDPNTTNQPPVCDAARPTQAIWPPNHKWVQVGITGVTDPDGDQVSLAVTGISQDEPVSGKGDGNTAPDGRIDGSTGWVRAERTGVKSVPGDGRIYEIEFTANDGNGGTCSGSVLVGVPHEKGQRSMPLDSNRRWNSITGAVIR